MNFMLTIIIAVLQFYLWLQRYNAVEFGNT